MAVSAPACCHGASVEIGPMRPLTDFIFSSARMSQNTLPTPVGVVGLVADCPTHIAGGTGLMVTGSRGTCPPDLTEIRRDIKHINT